MDSIQIAEPSDHVRALAQKWITQGVPKTEEFHGLTPNEARAVAYMAGYNTNHELHCKVREGCARAAGEEVVPIPDDRFYSAKVGTIRTFNGGQINLFETIDGAVIRLRTGINQVEMRRRNFGSSDQEFVTHILQTLKPCWTFQTIDWQGASLKVWVRDPVPMWVLQYTDESIYQLHPQHAYRFALRQMQELISTKG